ncbi:MAG: protein translocase subunit SecF [bacterium]|nr:protein translocase subunit SecF [bacterium]
MIRIIPHRWYFISFFALLVVVSLGLLFQYGLKLSADFVEGTLYEVQFAEEVSQTELFSSLSNYVHQDESVLGNVEVKQTDYGSFVLRLKRLDTAQQDEFTAYLGQKFGELSILQSRVVSPTFAKSFRDKAILAVVVASVMIVLYITFAFRGVSRGIRSWKLGLASVIAMIANVVILVGLYVVLGIFYGVEIDGLFLTALLTVMGYSVNDTIVVFDRVRENMFSKGHLESFGEVAEKSLHQTMARSINTGFGTILMLMCLLLFGADELYYFILALLVGIVVGTSSSIFLATPLLTVMRKDS